MKALKSGQIALFESQRNARRTADLEEHLESLDLSRLQNIKDSADKLKEYQIIFAIHKTISANVREKIEINALIDLINANEDME